MDLLYNKGDENASMNWTRSTNEQNSSEIFAGCTSLIDLKEINVKEEKSVDNDSKNFNLTANNIESYEKFGSSIDFFILDQKKLSSVKDVADPFNKSRVSNSLDQEPLEFQEKMQKFNGAAVHESRSNRNENDGNDLSNKNNSAETMQCLEGLPGFWIDGYFKGNHGKLINVLKTVPNHAAGISSSGCITASKDLPPARKRSQEVEGHSPAPSPKQLRILASKLIRCNICSEQFKKRKQLFKHKQEQHPQEDSYKCNLCGKAYIGLSHVENHKVLAHAKIMARGTKTPKSRCDYCDKSFTLLRDLLTRMLSVQSVKKKLRCEKCDSYFINIDFFLAHMRTHMGMFAFTCEKCGLLFECQNSLQGHIRRNHKRQSKRYSCSRCKSEIDEWKEYEIHLKSHEQEDKYNFPCTMCSAKFILRFDLEHHMFSHHQSVSDYNLE